MKPIKERLPHFQFVIPSVREDPKAMLWLRRSFGQIWSFDVDHEITAFK